MTNPTSDPEAPASSEANEPTQDPTAEATEPTSAESTSAASTSAESTSAESPPAEQTSAEPPPPVAVHDEDAAIRRALLDAQRTLQGQKRSVVVLLAGLDGGGRSELMNRLHNAFDARGLSVVAFDRPSDEEDDRPRFWRYWRALPAAGRIALMLGGWYAGPVHDRVRRRIGRSSFAYLLERIARHERMLALDGVVLIKLFFRISKRDQRRKLKRLESDPETAWRVTARDWKNHARYDRICSAWATALHQTSQPGAPWIEVDEVDERDRERVAAQAIVERLQAVCAGADVEPPTSELAPWNDEAPRLSHLVMEATPGPVDYEHELAELQGEIARLSWRARREQRSTVVVLEGWDAAGKGGAIRRLNAALDARLSQVISIAAPTDEERAHPYLWRFWRHLPRGGHLTIYDRSWYGRVLVERVEGFAAPADWQRAYAEINEFEQQLRDRDIALVKCWLHITPEEQLRRFEERQQTPWKQHKITSEDWRNREKWPAYEQAVDEMLGRTHTPGSPWTLVAANDKKQARLHVLRAVRDALSR